ncbi:hypothetical protein [Kordia sp.]
MKGGINSNACATNEECFTLNSCPPDTIIDCPPTVETRTDDSLM